ncbi:hypothetical protein QJS10_CPB11g01856 [Acorus calamus]|uniref:Translation initiation factor IF-2, chloroplastic n=1 Tax=Acorus calamus TaxID=4465 RepID=A0AAV9DSR3_ACOCL|nr:hypothetical protein QJS10_CPB11g01856 [Acorus calamus]
MASPASLASLGSARASPSSMAFDVHPSSSPTNSIRRTSSTTGRLTFGVCARRWSRCRCMVTTTGLIEPSGTATVASFDGDAADADLVLKPAPKPVAPKPAQPTVPWAPPPKLVRDRPDDREKVIESLDEVLEKAEKLETANNGPARSNGRADKPPLSPPRFDKPGKAKTLKSVWRKGNPVSNPQRAVTKPPPPPPLPPPSENSATPTLSVLPKKAQPNLQSKPTVAPPPPPPARKSVILKDVGASTNSTTTTTGRKQPILVDRFASKKPIVDPIVAQNVIAPPKPMRGFTGALKAKDERRGGFGKKAAGSRRRLVNKDGTDIEEASELNVAIPGAGMARKKGRKWSKASRKAARLEAAKAAAPVKAEILEVPEEGMSMDDLCHSLALGEGEVLGFLFSKGIRPDGFQTLDKDLVKMVCKEYEVEVIEAGPVRVEDMAKKKEVLDEEDLDSLETRPPVITIMGHVDHGKTTLLDYIRKSKVAASEAGGITQGIGAYKVLVDVEGKPQPCIFLDTPGHEAFGAMRARGTRVTDIVIIVVAADDGVRPQTNEAIAHAKAAGVPIVVAINKIDKEGASAERTMQELSSIGLMPEDWGGDVPMVQMQELKANPNRYAKGTVIEAAVDKSKGPVATFIVQNGTLKRGDVVVTGGAYGKVRALFDDGGKRVDEAGPSTAVQVIGINNVPVAGDEFEVAPTLDAAREKADACAESMRSARISAKAGEGKVTLSSIASTVSAGKQSGLDRHQLNIILKVDVQGSIEAIRQALQVLPQENVSLKFLLQAPGDVGTSDVDLAFASKAVIFGFNVKVPGSVRSHADGLGVEIRLYKVIYELLDDMRGAMEGLLDPVEEQVSIGNAEVRAVFSSGSGRFAGCMVREGKFMEGCGVRIIRKGKAVYTGKLDSLRRVKETVKEVGAGLECGIGVEDYTDWEVGDIIEAFNMVKKQRTLEEAAASVTAALVGAGVEL